MKKIFFLIAVFAISFFPAAAALVWAQFNPPVSFHLTVAKKTLSGDGSFDFEIKRQGAVVPIGIKNLFSVFAATDISDIKNAFSVATQNGQGTYSADYTIYDFSGIELREIERADWKLKTINCRFGSVSEDPFYFVSGNSVVFYGIADGEDIYCEFINEKVKNPVLIVPGLLGTELYEGEQEVWPNVDDLMVAPFDNFLNELLFDNELNSEKQIIPNGVIGNVSALFDYTDKLINLLTTSEVGYVADENLFTFPYDWRYGMTGEYPDGQTNMDLLAEKIEEIRVQTGAENVDVIAHSLGGLIVKKYIMDSTNDAPAHIGKLIFVGTPNLGSPIAAKAILMGHNFNIAVLSGGKIKEISENMPAAHDLLPSLQYRDAIANYIKLVEEQADGTFLSKNLGFGESQSFLAGHGANAIAQSNANLVHNISGLDNFDPAAKGADVYKITGCASAMPMQIKATKSFAGAISYEPYSYISSDDTVPFGSADSIPAENSKSFYVIKAKHGALMGQNGVRQTIANILAGTNLAAGDNVINKNQLIHNVNLCALNGVAIRIYSPLNIEVVDQNGKRLGLDQNNDPQNDIPGASFEIVDEHKFVYLPQDQAGEYQINLQGTATGTFSLETQNITNNLEGAPRIFENIPVNASLRATLETGADAAILKLDNDGNGQIDETLSRGEVAGIDIDTVIADVNRYYEAGMIKTKVAKNLLLAQLKALKVQISVLKKLQANQKLPQKAKTAAVRVLSEVINKQIGLLIKEIEKMSGKAIDTPAAQTLIDSLGHILIK